MQIRVVLFGIAALRGRKFDLRLNTDESPIANKYHEGKMKRTLKRELKVLEIVGREAVGGGSAPRFYASRRGEHQREGLVRTSWARGRYAAGATRAGRRFPTGPSRNTDQGV